MKEREIIDLWKKGLSKGNLSKIYRREYNQKIKVVRSSVRHRHDGYFISNLEALAHVEKVLYKYLKSKNK